MMMVSKIMLTIQFAVGLVFLWSAVAKAIRPRAFVHGLSEYRLVSERFAYVVGILGIVAELVFGLSHISGWLFQSILTGAIAFLLILMLVVVNAVKRGLSVPCLCFGANSEAVSARTIARLSLMLASEVVLWLGVHARYYRPEEALSLNQFLPLLVSAGLTLLVAAWILVVPDLNALRRRCRRCNRGVG